MRTQLRVIAAGLFMPRLSEIKRRPSSPKHFAIMFQRILSTGLALRASQPQGFHFLQPVVTRSKHSGVLRVGLRLATDNVHHERHLTDFTPAKAPRNALHSRALIPIRHLLEHKPFLFEGTRIGTTECTISLTKGGCNGSPRHLGSAEKWDSPDVDGLLDSGMVYASCSFRGSFRLNKERRYHDGKRPYG
jgi:hypothetical protein